MTLAAVELRNAAEDQPRPASVRRASGMGPDATVATASHIFSAAELYGREFPVAREAVAGLLPEGLTVLAGRPKLGKSWLALNLASYVALGTRALGKFDVTKGTALYYALEDNPRRLQRRLRTLFPTGGVPTGLGLSVSLARLDAGGIDALQRDLDERPDCRVAIIDTLARIRPPKKKNEDSYQADSDFGAALQRVALDRGLSLVIVHHLRKADSEDVFERVSGTTGLTGAADALLVLERQRGTPDAVLHVTGRDVEEAEYALRFDSELGSWACIGGAAEIRLTRERQEVLDFLRRTPLPATPKAVADALGKPPGAMRTLLWRMSRDGQVRVGLKSGTYVPASYEGSGE